MPAIHGEHIPSPSQKPLDVIGREACEIKQRMGTHILTLPATAPAAHRTERHDVRSCRAPGALVHQVRMRLPGRQPGLIRLGINSQGTLQVPHRRAPDGLLGRHPPTGGQVAASGSCEHALQPKGSPSGSGHRYQDMLDCLM